MTHAGAPEGDGRHDFDFLFGRWRVANRRLSRPLDERGSEWSEFASVMETRPVLGGLGNIDTYFAADLPGRGAFHGLTVRLFEPDAADWRIWWASTFTHGQLDTPMVGRFVDDEGHFECDDVLEGREVRVRFLWTGISPTRARWEQSFSFDHGATYALNWVMELRRDG